MNENVINFLSFLESAKTRCKEIHWNAAYTMSYHELADDVLDGISDYQDSIAEEAQALYGNIKIGELNPVKLSMEIDTLTMLLSAIRAELAKMKDVWTEKMFTGLVNETDDYWHLVNKQIYLARICQK
jgi:hypothetical protein